MRNEGLRINYSPISSSTIDDGNWVKLEQKLETPLAYYASVRDIYKMWTLAVSGISARSYRPIGCPIEFVEQKINIFLGFYAWPSDPALNYTLSPSIGIIGPEQAVELPREFSAFVNNSDYLDLPYYMEDVQVEWETDCFNQYGERIPRPEITKTPLRLLFSTEVFGAVRIKGKAIGGYYLLTISLDKPMTQEEMTQEDYQNMIIEQIQDRRIIFNPPPAHKLNGTKIANVESTITVSWLDPAGNTITDQLELDIPQCVKDALNFCPNMYQTLVYLCEEISTRKVYYSTCKEDTIVAIIDGQNPFSFCQDLS